MLTTRDYEMKGHFLNASKMFVPRLVKAAATDDKKAFQEASEQLSAAFNCSYGEHWYIYNLIHQEILDVVFSQGAYTKTWTFSPKSFRGAVESGDVSRVEAIIKTLWHCIYELDNLVEYHGHCFMKRALDLDEILNSRRLDEEKDAPAIVLAVRAAGSHDTNKDNKIVKNLCAVVTALKSNGADIQIETKYGNLLSECARGVFSYEMFSHLLQSGVNPNNGYPIATYVNQRNNQAIKALIEHNAEYKDLNGESILHLAVRHSSEFESKTPQTIRFITTLDSSLLTREDKQGNIPLVTAVTAGSTDTIKLLIQLHDEEKKPIDKRTKCRCIRSLCDLAIGDVVPGDIKQKLALLINCWGANIVNKALAKDNGEFAFDPVFLPKIAAVLPEVEKEALKKDAFPQTLWSTALRSQLTLISEYACEKNEEILSRFVMAGQRAK